MRQSEPANGQSSKSSDAQLGESRHPRPNGRNGIGHHIGRRICKFGLVVKALFPVKPALHLAQLDGGSVRGAQHEIDGDRKPTAKAVHAVVGEIIESS